MRLSNSVRCVREACASQVARLHSYQVLCHVMGVLGIRVQAGYLTPPMSAELRLLQCDGSGWKWGHLFDRRIGASWVAVASPESLKGCDWLRSR